MSETGPCASVYCRASMTPPLQPLVTAALQAGTSILRFYGRDVTVHQKADRSPVTEADRAAETIILEHLARIAPAIPVVAEEQAAAGCTPEVGARFFLVDPLDGTQEFIRNRGDFTVNIALIENGAPILGVVYAPVRQWLFAGDLTAGRSAWRSDVAAGVESGERRVIRARTPPSEGVVVVASRSHRTPETDAYLDCVSAQYPISELICVGSSLKFCLVAAGEADLYPRFGPTMEWDTAAGHAVVLAAGGSVVTPDGQPLRYGKAGFRNGAFIARGA